MRQTTVDTPWRPADPTVARSQRFFRWAVGPSRPAAPPQRPVTRRQAPSPGRTVWKTAAVSLEPRDDDRAHDVPLENQEQDQQWYDRSAHRGHHQSPLRVVAGL